MEKLPKNVSSMTPMPLYVPRSLYSLPNSPASRKKNRRTSARDEKRDETDRVTNDKEVIEKAIPVNLVKCREVEVTLNENEIDSWKGLERQGRKSRKKRRVRQPNYAHKKRFLQRCRRAPNEKLFAAKCYNVDIHLCGRKWISHMLAAIFDTGIDQNLIGKEALSSGFAHDIREIDTLLRSAGCAVFKVDVVIRLWVDLEECVSHVSTGVAPTLATKIITKILIDS